MTSSATPLVSLEEPAPESSVGTGAFRRIDEISNRFRDVLVGSDASKLAGLQPTDYASFGAWFRNRRQHDPKARFMYALWQQSERPPLPKPKKPLNRDVLAKITSRAAEKQLSRADQANGVVATCTTNKQFYEIVLPQMRACHSVAIYADSAWLDGPHLARPYSVDVDGDLFATLCGLGSLVFPEVGFGGGGYAESVLPKLNSVERLFLRHQWPRSDTEMLFKQLFEKNKDSLKVLQVNEHLLSLIPEGLRLEEFSCTDPDEIPPLETKVFICKYLHKKFPLPPPFLRTVSAEEIRIEAMDIHQPDPTDTLAPKPASSRVKKLTITVPPIELPNLASLFRDITAMCPQLECLELGQDSKFYTDGGYGNLDLIVDELAANIQGIMEDRSAPFNICLKMKVKFVARLWPVANYYARRNDNDVDVAPHEFIDESKKTLRLFRETSDGENTLRVDCEIYM